VKPAILRLILQRMTNREQFFLSMISDLMMLIKQMDEGRVANSFATGCVGEVVTTISEALGLEYDEVGWLLAFLSAGPAMSGPTSPPAAAPPAAGEAPEPPADEHADEVPFEHPDGGYEGLNASYGRTGGLTY
jgi:hypothetical protein